MRVIPTDYSTLISLLIFWFNSLVQTKAEVFSAISEIEGLLKTEKEAVLILEEYLKAEEQRLDRIRHYAKEYERMSKEAETDIQSYASNPVSAYLLIKRLTADWLSVATIMLTNPAQDILGNISITRIHVHFPDGADLNGAAMGLIRLQNMYELDARTIADGQIPGVKSSPKLTANDCYELGRQAYVTQDHDSMYVWMVEAMRRLEEENPKTMDKTDILEHYAYACYMKENVKMALKYTLDLLELDPAHPRAEANRIFYGEIILQEIQSDLKNGKIDIIMPEPPALDESTLDVYQTERLNYERLCRKQVRQDPKIVARLKCRYTYKHPYLTLQPIKVEELLLDPYVVQFYDILSDTEIKMVKLLAAPKLNRSMVLQTDGPTVSTYRVSKQGWLDDKDDKVIAAITRRVSDVTGLNMDSSEQMQVVNYGIGGHYDPHNDYFHENDLKFTEQSTGNRIATMLFYMSDVEAGGATVFPLLDIGVWPVKGSAAFWYNLKRNGEGDVLSRHAACPVLTGSKWVCNKWIHEKFQEFIRPCTINPKE